MDIEIEDYSPNQYFIKYGEVNGTQTITIFNNQSTLHSIIKSDIFNEPKESSIFSFNNKYSTNVFYGIMPNTKAIKIFTAKKP